MASFYNQSAGAGSSSGGGGGNGNGFYNQSSSGSGSFNYDFHQTQNQNATQSHHQFGNETSNDRGASQSQQQQQTTQGNFQQWAPSATGGTTQQYAGGQSQSQSQPQAQAQPQAQTNNNSNFWNPSNTVAMAGLAAQAMQGGGMSMDDMMKIVPGGMVPPMPSNVPGFGTVMITLRAYFAVDNRYVVRKMKKVLFPFLSKQWRRMLVEGPELVNYAPPIIDENAPDLYLPVMSLITYCLLCALTYGTSGQFNPEVIPDVTSKCFITQVLEVILIRLGFYMMNAPTPILDLFSYTGYKYLGLTMNMIFAIVLGKLGYGTSGFYVTFLWTASAATFFMLKTMANNIPTETAATGPKREVMVLVFAISQAASMWFVSQTKFL